MAATSPKPETCKQLTQLLAALTNTIGETLGSLVGRPITVRSGELVIQEAAQFTAGRSRPTAVVRGAVDQDCPRRSLLVVIDLPDAIAMAALLMMVPEDTVAARRAAGKLDGEDDQAFGELGNVLFSGFNTVLQEQLGNTGVRRQDHLVLGPGQDGGELFGRDRVVTFGFRLQVGGFPESLGALVVDLDTAEAWNKAPFATTAAMPRPAGGAGSDEDAYEQIPAAPIRGTLAAFVSLPAILKLLRLAARRVGLELRRHGKGEIPNPAAHRNQIVLIDVPPGEDRRFDWCRRIKDISPSTRVVLMLHHPSRQLVTQAFLSHADAILGHPCDEPTLSQKLAQVLDSAPPASP